MALEYKDYDDFVKKHGELYTGKPVANAVRLMCNWADGIGMLLKRARFFRVRFLFSQSNCIVQKDFR